MNVFDKDKTLLLWTPQMGLVVRQDGVLKYISKGVDASQELVDGEYEWRENHLVQPTASQQPRLVGGIAPNSKVAASNQNGEARYFTHPAITFADGDSYTINFFFEDNGIKGVTERWFGKLAGATEFQTATGNRAATFVGQSSVFISLGNIGYTRSSKLTLYTLTVNSSKLVSLYVNAVFNSSGTITNSSAIFDSVLKANSVSQATGRLYAYHIQSGALTPTQVTAEYNLLRSMYPEIESVDIGIQTWATRNFEAVATPVGNVIANVTEGGAVDKIANGSFTGSETGWSLQTNWAYGTNNIVGTFDGTTRQLYQAIAVPITNTTKYVKITYTIVSNTGDGVLRMAGLGTHSNSVSSGAALQLTAGTYSFIQKTAQTGTRSVFGLEISGGTTGSIVIDDIKCEELNWSNATEIYDAVYAATSGTHNQKHYAALKESAMWRYPNNSIDKGAWGGKLYNKYAMMLLSLDMASANFGYHIPTNAEVVELLAQVGGDTNKLKYVGLDYWNDAIGTNESGLTLLGTGVITPGGVYTGEKELTGFWTSDSNEFPTSGLPIRIVKNV